VGGDLTDRRPSPTAPERSESLSQLLGGRRGAADATLPAVAFAAGWLLADRQILAGAVAALGAGAALAGWRMYRGDRPRAAVLGMCGVAVASLVALHTGRAEDFFLVQLLSNAASALVWASSILVRWPLLGVVAGTALGQRTRWRQDPALLRAYSAASWVWVGQYLVRLLVFVPLWYAGHVIALTMARVALSWPLVALCVGASWWVLRRALPDGHPGLRHPRAG
jgi:hypothetical protein